jgi:hypothetical protein
VIAAAPLPPPLPIRYECADVLPIAGALGVYDFTNGRITLQTPVCERLALIRFGVEPRSIYAQRDFAEAIFIIGHEAAHAAGIEDERAADCRALARFARWARLAGARPAFARVLRGYAVAATMQEGCE